MKLIHPKTLWRRFRAWQERPFHYKNHSQGTQHCANCGTTFNDNFCPRCGQAAGSGRVGWNTIRYGVMEMWNLESRSLLTTLWQLLLRPGHLIDDYLSGKRQTSYPPVKMLLMVAVGIDIIRNLLGIPPNGATSISEADVNSLLSLYNQWAEQNQGWSSHPRLYILHLPPHLRLPPMGNSLAYSSKSFLLYLHHLHHHRWHRSHLRLHPISGNRMNAIAREHPMGCSLAILYYH